MRALVTGATRPGGARASSQPRHRPRVAAASRGARVSCSTREAGCEYVGLGDLGAGADVTGIATGCDVVIHAAARVHVMRETRAAPTTAYQDTNVAGTLRVAREAARCGVRRFIFISSVKVNGESSPAGRPFREDDPRRPPGPLRDQQVGSGAGPATALCAQMGMEFVVIRPPLVYGPEAVAQLPGAGDAHKAGDSVAARAHRAIEEAWWPSTISCISPACAWNIQQQPTKLFS